MMLRNEILGVSTPSSRVTNDSNNGNNNNNNNTEESIVVQDNDVLSGRGGSTNKHPGNLMFRRVVNQNKEHYQSCDTKAHKYLLAISIIAAVERQGGRFLQDESEKGEEPRYVKISRKKAFEKTSQALREPKDSRAKKSTEAAAEQTQQQRPPSPRAQRQLPQQAAPQQQKQRQLSQQAAPQQQSRRSSHSEQQQLQSQLHQRMGQNNMDLQLRQQQQQQQERQRRQLQMLQEQKQQPNIPPPQFQPDDFGQAELRGNSVFSATPSGSSWMPNIFSLDGAASSLAAHSFGGQSTFGQNEPSLGGFDTTPIPLPQQQNIVFTADVGVAFDDAGDHMPSGICNIDNESNGSCTRSSTPGSEPDSDHRIVLHRPRPIQRGFSSGSTDSISLFPDDELPYSLDEYFNC